MIGLKHHMNCSCIHLRKTFLLVQCFCFHLVIPDRLKRFKNLECPHSVFITAVDVLLHFGQQLPVSLAYSSHINPQCKTKLQWLTVHKYVSCIIFKYISVSVKCVHTAALRQVHALCMADTKERQTCCLFTLLLQSFSCFA